MADQDPPSNADRESILARRALFVTTAIAAFGCSSQGSTDTTPSTSTVVETATTTTTTTTTGGAVGAGTTAPPPPSSPRRPWASVLEEAPPFAIPASMRADEKTALDGVEQLMRAQYDKLKPIWEKAPVGCSPKDATCDADWKKTAEVLAEIEDDVSPPKCGFGNNATSAVIRRHEAHARYLHEIMRSLAAELASSARKFNAESAWSELVGAAERPQPCLKCAMSGPPREVSAAEISFQVGKRDISSDEERELDALKTLLTAEASLKLEVRGHADAGEGGDLHALAKQRAEAVRDWLMKNGIAAGRISVVEFGADLPVGSPKTDAGRAENRRVDFHAR